MRYEDLALSSFDTILPVGNEADGFPCELWGDADPEAVGAWIQMAAEGGPSTSEEVVDTEPLVMSSETVEFLRRLGNEGLKVIDDLLAEGVTIDHEISTDRDSFESSVEN
jgi:hypothetical protein